jgi:hypothetical protein
MQAPLVGAGGKQISKNSMLAKLSAPQPAARRSARGASVRAFMEGS